MDRPLDGIKVIDCSTAGAGPSCTKLLTEYGADTIWVEPVYGASTRSVFKYDFYCSGKRSLALDLKTNEGKKILDDLLVTADVFVSNYRTKALERLGLTYERLSTLNPRLIYAALTAYGDAGPDADKPGYDPVVFWARGGMLRDFAEKGQMLIPPMAAGDIISGQALAGGICAALFQRSRTGLGSKVFTSLLAQAAYFNHDAIIESQYGETYPKSRMAPRRALLNTYRCADEKWIVITITDRFDHYFWPLLKAVGREDLVGDPRWTCIQDTMYERAPELVAILDAAFAKLTQEEAISRLEELDIPAGRVSSTEEMLTDDQAWVNHFLFSMPTTDGKDLTVPANPVKFGDSTSGTTGYGPGPRIGEHSVEILREYGTSEEDIRALIENGVIIDGNRPQICAQEKRRV